MTGGLTFREAKPALIRGLVEERIDPVLFALSHNYVGDLAETTALIWPGPDQSPPSWAGRVHAERAGEGPARPFQKLREGITQARAITTRRPPSRP
ncbi:hypothetical protein GCM10025880_03130 [Methylorubrum aminovorans]|nr:hypothetical protein GCM10025880_03130 [Methylorubrum aminovorans]